MDRNTSPTWTDARPVHITELAAIVRDLVAGGVARLHDDQWFRDRAMAAGLDAHECAALDALRTRMLDTGAVFLEDADANRIWL